MKKRFVPQRKAAVSSVLAAGTLLVALSAPVGAYAESRIDAAARPAAYSPEAAEAQAKQKREVMQQAQRALRALADGNFGRLADLAAPSGIRFSPYAYVSKETDVVLTASQLRGLKTDKKAYDWGEYDGSGEPIRLDFYSYYNEFLHNLPYTAPNAIGYNRIVRSGNTISNLAKVYPKASFVEFYVKGGRSDHPSSEGMDWGSLRFVFEQSGGEWKLFGIVGDRWTI
ncbi:hypothetical protein QWJ34_26470 [Saccharibacillus sp. CPCC 101409]|uniref:hypothetical protein n=1 Tax=Saccharibacillus sp. CPCC 101409 TaxID=3058041 RepID=UPI002671151B|nr:hypothetical protein [Saccharibacillus sp. CPCC 101409]MDO3413325.1 hypothetical protein [Saccharibacillus sp. CPCC 101409]